jgi:hypothetical protein
MFVMLWGQKQKRAPTRLDEQARTLEKTKAGYGCVIVGATGVACEIICHKTSRETAYASLLEKQG